MSINRGDFDLRQIFEQVVQSITRVSGAKAATLISLPDEPVGNQEVFPKTVLSISDGLGPDYDQNIRPRKDGLTLAVMRERKPIAVSHPDAPIGINPGAGARHQGSDRSADDRRDLRKNHWSPVCSP